MAFSNTAKTESSLKDSQPYDVEQAADAHLLNTTVRNISWQGVTVSVTDRTTKSPRKIVENVDGVVKAGKLHRA